MATILTVTLNPTVDKSCSVAKVMPEEKLRCSELRHDPGGGGINVARAIDKLGGQSTALWTRGGHVGGLLSRLLDRENIPHEPLDIEGLTREHLIVYEQASGKQYRFGMPGPELKAGEVDRLVGMLSDRDAPPDYLVLSGSLPGGVDSAIYARISRGMPQSCRVVVDTKADVLKRSLETPAYLIKPNLRELGHLAGRDIESDEEIAEFSRKLIDQGKVQVVITSLGSGGAMFVTAEQSEQLRSPTVKIRSKVGAGDSMVGGIVLGLARGWAVRDAARFGVAAGAAAVMTEGTELCRREDAEQLFEKMGR